MPTRNKTIDDALETFVTAFCYGRSRTHPYEATRYGDVWAMRDAPRKNPRDYRKEEWVAYDVPAGEVDALARANTRGRFFVCAVIDTHENDSAETEDRVRAEYKALGYRLMAREGLFTHGLTRIPRCPSPAPIELVRTADMAAR